MEAGKLGLRPSPSARRPTPPGKAATSYRTPRRLPGRLVPALPPCPGSQQAPSSRNDPHPLA
eukprot:3606842-Heterocapsa_arctica.AAC.1